MAVTVWTGLRCHLNNRSSCLHPLRCSADDLKTMREGFSLISLRYLFRSHNEHMLTRFYSSILRTFMLSLAQSLPPFFPPPPPPTHLSLHHCYLSSFRLAKMNCIPYLAEYTMGIYNSSHETDRKVPSTRY